MAYPVLRITSICIKSRCFNTYRIFIKYQLFPHQFTNLTSIRPQVAPWWDCTLSFFINWICTGINWLFINSKTIRKGLRSCLFEKSTEILLLKMELSNRTNKNLLLKLQYDAIRIIDKWRSTTRCMPIQ